MEARDDCRAYRRVCKGPIGPLQATDQAGGCASIYGSALLKYDTKITHP